MSRPRVWPVIRCAAIVVCCACCLAAAPKSEQPAGPLRIELVRDAQRKADQFRVSGFSAAQAAWLSSRPWAADAGAWQNVFRVRVGQEDEPSIPPIAGAYRVDDGALVFQPSFPLTAGLSYTASLSISLLPDVADQSPPPLTRVFHIPKPATGPPTLVTGIYPSGDVLPENLLRFYIHFSAPMSHGMSYRNIRLLNDAGDIVEGPFVEVPQELWDPTQTRFTLLFEPGRIKRGILPNEELGPVLEAGRRYTLEIDRRWLDAAGNPLRESARKTFTVGAADHMQPDPNQWRISAPRASTRDPLSIDFDEPLDHAMISRVIYVIDARGQTIAGAVNVDRGETRWRFTPAEPWPAGRYRIRVATTLEDRIGNSIAKPFEVHPSQREQFEAVSDFIELPFFTAEAASDAAP